MSSPAHGSYFHSPHHATMPNNPAAHQRRLRAALPCESPVASRLGAPACSDSWSEVSRLWQYRVSSLDSQSHKTTVLPHPAIPVQKMSTLMPWRLPTICASRTDQTQPHGQTWCAAHTRLMHSGPQPHCELHSLQEEGFISPRLPNQRRNTRAHMTSSRVSKTAGFSFPDRS